MLRVVLKTYLMSLFAVGVFFASAMGAPFVFVGIALLVMAPAVVAGFFNLRAPPDERDPT